MLGVQAMRVAGAWLTVSEPPAEGPEELSTNATPPSPTFALPLPPLSRAPSPTISSICSLLTPGVPAPSCRPCISLLRIVICLAEATARLYVLSILTYVHSPQVKLIRVILAAEGGVNNKGKHLEEPEADAWVGRQCFSSQSPDTTCQQQSSRSCAAAPLHCTLLAPSLHSAMHLHDLRAWDDAA